MRSARTFSQVWVWIGAGVFLLLILSVQLFLTLHQHYPQAVSDEVSEKSRAFLEETKQTLEQRNEQATP